MYSTKRNIQQLLSLMMQHNVVDVVICPGSRNMPLAQSFGSHPSFHCYPVTDERSGGFFAIGVSLCKARPVAVCVTSGSALLELCSAVSEAYYQQIPLLVISADRPSAWIGQMDGQTLPQTNVFGSLVRKEVTLTEPPIPSDATTQNDATDLWFNNRLINEALLELNHHVKGPVHINVPLSEPFFDCTSTEIPVERCIRRNAPYIKKWENAQSPLIIVGQLQKKDADEINEKLERLNCSIFCELLSNIHNSHTVGNFDYILKTNNDLPKPDLVIYIGGHIVSKNLKKWIRNFPPQECWRVDPSGECADTFQCLTNIIEQKNITFIQSLPPKTGTNAFYDFWINNREKDESSLFPIDEEERIITLIKQRLPRHSHLILANSNTVRNAQKNFNIRKNNVEWGMKETDNFNEKNISVVCNRGVNGIDGTMSTAVGYSIAKGNEPVFLIIGDLSFFYDMNGLWNTQLPQNLHIALLNNHGGQIFEKLQGLRQTEETNVYVRATHTVNAEGWIRSLNGHYFASHGIEEHEDAVDRFINHEGFTVVEFFTDTPSSTEK